MKIGRFLGEELPEISPCLLKYFRNSKDKTDLWDAVDRARRPIRVYLYIKPEERREEVYEILSCSIKICVI